MHIVVNEYKTYLQHFYFNNSLFYKSVLQVNPIPDQNLKLMFCPVTMLPIQYYMYIINKSYSVIQN